MAILAIGGRLSVVCLTESDNSGSIRFHNRLHNSVDVKMNISTKLVTMKDVAELAGVSTSTVSRVINNPEVPMSAQTRQKVQQAVEALDYSPNPSASGLRTKSGKLLGLIVPDFYHLHAFVCILNYIENAARRYGYDLILATTKNDPLMEEQMIMSLLRRHVDGIILSSESEKSRVPKLARSIPVPVVVVDRGLDTDSLPSAIIDNYAAGSLAAGYLLEYGHKHVACITGPLSISICRERLRGFEDKCSELIEKGSVLEGDFQFGSGKAAARKILAKQRNVTAIWAQNDVMAAGVLSELYSRGIRVPADISVMGMDDTELAEMTIPPLTTIAQPFREMSEWAVMTVLGIGNRSNTRSNHAVLSASIHVRESVKRIDG